MENIILSLCAKNVTNKILISFAHSYLVLPGPSLGNIFERLIFNEMFGLSLDHSLIITPHQSDFKSNDSYLNILLSITHESHEDFLMHI